MDDPRLDGRVPQHPRLRRRPSEGLLAEDVLARPDRRQARLEVEVVGRAVVEDVDRGVLDQLLPADPRALESVPGPRQLRLRRSPARHPHEPRHRGRRPQHLPHERVGVRVRLADPRRPEETDADWSCVTKIGRLAERPLDLLQLGPDASPQLRVQVGQRLVQQQHVRLDDKGPSERNPLLLSAG